MSESISAHTHNIGAACSVCGMQIDIAPELKENAEDPVLKEEAAAIPISTIIVTYGDENEFKIEVKRQKQSNDCGQTCLEMLGYTDHNIQDRELTNTDVWALFQSTHQEVLASYDAPRDYKTPHLVLLPTGTKKILQAKHNHWVVRVNDFVIDPAKGVITAGDFERIHAGKEMLTIKAPSRSLAASPV